ncbi:MAG TPA: OsmC family protein [Cyclobacteriaceae bacterium]|nr:OsmC family protein [Cyclobacteriaceae bacterium]
MEEEKIAVATISDEVYRTELKVRKHTLIADEPEDVGGKDVGPRPGDFLRMSLASCTAITLRMYANRKKFDVKKIEVTVSTVEEERKTIFRTDVKINGNLDETQHERLLQIAKRCPVHKVLTNPIEIETQLSIVN